MIWNVIDTVNLYHTGIGVCDCQIHLCHEGILAIPEGMTNAVKVGAAAGSGHGFIAFGIVGGALARGSKQQIEDENNPEWMRFPLDDIEYVLIRKKLLTGSRLFVRMRNNSEQKFATDNINATHQARLLFGTIYADRYKEEKFRKPPDRKKACRTFCNQHPTAFT